MNQYSLFLHMAASQGVLRRILGVVEHRGFRVLSCQVDDVSGDAYHMRIDVVGERPSALLCRQLARLHDVSEAVVACGKPRMVQGGSG